MVYIYRSLFDVSCEIVALLENFVATIRSMLKVVYFLPTIWGIFLHFHTQPDQKQGIKKFIRHLPATIVPSLTLQSLTSLAM
jgi:hypothetical protein